MRIKQRSKAREIGLLSLSLVWLAIPTVGIADQVFTDNVVVVGGVCTGLGKAGSGPGLNSNPTWQVTIPGDTLSCGLLGSDNVQGRLLNNVAPQDVCGTPAISPSGNFFHIEQDPNEFRDATNWIAAINATWPLP